MVPYSGKFSNGLIFENFEGSQVFSKIFFWNQCCYHARALLNVSLWPTKMTLLKYCKHIEPSKEEKLKNSKRFA